MGSFAQESQSDPDDDISLRGPHYLIKSAWCAGGTLKTALELFGRSATCRILAGARHPFKEEPHSVKFYRCGQKCTYLSVLKDQLHPTLHIGSLREHTHPLLKVTLVGGVYGPGLPKQRSGLPSL